MKRGVSQKSANPLNLLARPEGFEPPTLGFVALSWGYSGIGRERKGKSKVKELRVSPLKRDTTGNQGVKGDIFRKLLTQMLTKTKG
jgi:hypothetical protein